VWHGQQVAKPMAVVQFNHFLGEWRDSLGNDVSVEPPTQHHYRHCLCVRLTSRRNKQTSLWLEKEGANHKCGSYTLDAAQSSPPACFVWRRHDGSESTWQRRSAKQLPQTWTNDASRTNYSYRSQRWGTLTKSAVGAAVPKNGVQSQRGGSVTDASMSWREKQTEQCQAGSSKSSAAAVGVGTCSPPTAQPADTPVMQSEDGGSSTHVVARAYAAGEAPRHQSSCTADSSPAAKQRLHQTRLDCVHQVAERSADAVAVGGYPTCGGTPAKVTNDSCRGGTGNKPRLEQISRKLSHVLRHGERVTVRLDGFCRVSDLLHLRRFQELGCTLKDLEMVVAGSPESGNSKERFQLIGGNEEGEDSSGPLIRATQGFSRKDVRADCAYRRLNKDDEQLPEPCVHGSYRSYWDSIRQSGLIAGGLKGHKYRSEVHFSCDDPSTIGGACAVSGMRSNCDLVIWLDLRQALRDGLPFFISDNQVILSPGNAQNIIPPKYFSKVLDVSGDHPVLIWKDGSPLPEGARY